MTWPPMGASEMPTRRIDAIEMVRFMVPPEMEQVFCLKTERLEMREPKLTIAPPFFLELRILKGLDDQWREAREMGARGAFKSAFDWQPSCYHKWYYINLYHNSHFNERPNFWQM